MHGQALYRLQDKTLSLSLVATSLQSINSRWLSLLRLGAHSWGALYLKNQAQSEFLKSHNTAYFYLLLNCFLAKT